LAAAISLQAVALATGAFRPNYQSNNGEAERTRDTHLRTVRLSSRKLRKRAVQCSVPLYPAFGKNVRAKGTVMVEVLVNPDGSVRSAEAVSGHPLLRASAVQAAMQWKFKPFTVNSRRLRAIGLLPIIFPWDTDEMNRQCEGLQIVE